VGIVKHLQGFQKDGVISAVENILGFEGLTPLIRAQIAQVFQSYGIPVPKEKALDSEAGMWMC